MELDRLATKYQLYTCTGLSGESLFWIAMTAKQLFHWGQIEKRAVCCFSTLFINLKSLDSRMNTVTFSVLFLFIYLLFILVSTPNKMRRLKLVCIYTI